MTSRTQSQPEFSNPKLTALQTALYNRDPFYSGSCMVPEYQRILYYTHGGLYDRVNFPNAGADDLEALYRACKPAEFGRNGENVLDESYRKAREMDFTSFSTLLDLRTLGIHERVSKALLTQCHATMDAELYKLNVYEKGDFFKLHKDTPRGQNMFGSLVIILSTVHEGDQFVLRQGEKNWTLDFASKFATAAEPSVFFVAFYGDIEHEVLPITSGYRVTLTYNLYHKPTHLSTFSSIPTPFQLNLKKALVDLVHDKSVLPNGGYLGFGLAHEYVHTGRNLLEPLLGQLKGSDRALADVCDELGLRYSLRLFYREISDPRVNLLSTVVLDASGRSLDFDDSPSSEFLNKALVGLTIEQVKGINLVGGPWPVEPSLFVDYIFNYYGSWLKPYYRCPITEVLEVTPMKSSVDVKVSFIAYVNEAAWDYFYGTACMLIALEPANSQSRAAV